MWFSVDRPRLSCVVVSERIAICTHVAYRYVVYGVAETDFTLSDVILKVQCDYSIASCMAIPRDTTIKDLRAVTRLQYTHPYIKPARC